MSAARIRNVRERGLKTTPYFAAAVGVPVST
jgi:hypothetical protein